MNSHLITIFSLEGFDYEMPFFGITFSESWVPGLERSLSPLSPWVPNRTKGVAVVMIMSKYKKLWNGYGRNEHSAAVGCLYLMCVRYVCVRAPREKQAASVVLNRRIMGLQKTLNLLTNVGSQTMKCSYSA